MPEGAPALHNRRWGRMMTLFEAIRDLDSFDDGSTIYASEPWSHNSQVLIAPEPVDGTPPKEARNLGLRYFVEVFIARDVLKGWAQSLENVPTPEEKCAMLIQYASYDP